jgi:hypothetical protein
MAAKFSASIVPDNSGTNIRLWAQFIEDLLVTTGGWVVTSDTGQTLPNALATPGAANTKVGYRIYRMNDALQATSPVFIRIDFGAGAGGAGVPAMGLIIGTGSNGSGTITGIVLNFGGVGSSSFLACQTNAVTAFNSYGSADPGRVCLGMFISTNTGMPWVMGIERTKNATGADTGTGLLVASGGAIVQTVLSNGMAYYNYLVLAGGTQPAVEQGFSFVISTLSPTQTFSPGDIGLGIPIPFKGVAQQPGTNFLVTNSNDVSVEGYISLTLYGQTRTYQQLNALAYKRTMRGPSTTTDASRVLMRYD